MRNLCSRPWVSRNFVLILTAASVWLFGSRPAEAQITVESVIGTAVSNSNDAQYQDVADALTRFQNGDVNAARELLARAKQKNPKLAPSEVMLARLLVAAGQLTLARAELERAVVAYPDDPEAYLLFAELALREGRTTDAETLFAKAKTLSDNFKENSKRQRNFLMRANAGLTGVAENRDQWDQATKFLKAWLELDPDSAAAHQHLGRAYFKLKNDKDAYEEFQSAVKLDPQLMNADIMMGQMYEDSKNRDQAVKFIQAAVKKNPQSLKVLLDAAIWAMVTNRMADAQSYADSALRVDPKSVDAQVVRGQVARMMGDLKTAESLLEQAHLQAPSNLNAANQLAIALADSNDNVKKQRALELAQLTLRVSAQGNQVNPAALTTLAWVYYRMGKGAEAEQLVGRILAGGMLNADIAYYVAKILQERGRADDATNLLEAALKNPAPFIQRQNASELLKQISATKAADAQPAKSQKTSSEDFKSK